MNKFPTEMPIVEARQLVNFATREDKDLPKAVLSAWVVAGYCGHLYFGDVQVQTWTAPPEDFEAMKAEFESKIDKGKFPDWLIMLALEMLMRYLRKSE